MGACGFDSRPRHENLAVGRTPSEPQDDFDLWFKRRLADSTGIDLNTPPEMSLPELLSSYSADTSA
jgi:hypothetical protein